VSIPLKWMAGDPCFVRGQIGKVDCIDGESCCVVVGERMLFVALSELDLVPLPKPEAGHGAGDEFGGEDFPSVDLDRELPAEWYDEPGRLGLVKKTEAYGSFVATKLSRVPPTGLTCQIEPHASLFPFQRELVTWAARRGRAALFADTGLGKTAMQLDWARLVAQHAGGDILILAPLAVAAQTVREGERLGIPVRICRSADDIEPGINITNYDRLHKFDPSRFVGVVLDESSIIKHHDAKTLARLLEAFRDTPFKLCATATPSPNDYTELGTHAEFLGICSRVEMLAEYFVHDGGDTSKWRLKGHARAAFWKWMATWAALLRKPSDLGYDDGGYQLPELRITQHTIAADPDYVKSQGLLFAEPARTLTERRQARKTTLSERVQRCVAQVQAEPGESWVIWCELTAEADALASALPGAVEIRGADEPHIKESRLVAFAQGEFKILITKPSIAGFGLNWQHAARMAFVGVKDSWESYYQAIRREWRFGQKRAVEVHVFSSELEGEVVANLRRKEKDALAMAEQLSAETREAVLAEVRGLTRETNDYSPTVTPTRPAWLRGAA
jgi:superfamily II DNA or RNA helicase